MRTQTEADLNHSNLHYRPQLRRWWEISWSACYWSATLIIHHKRSNKHYWLNGVYNQTRCEDLLLAETTRWYRQFNNKKRWRHASTFKIRSEACISSNAHKTQAPKLSHDEKVTPKRNVASLDVWEEPTTQHQKKALDVFLEVQVECFRQFWLTQSEIL